MATPGFSTSPLPFEHLTVASVMMSEEPRVLRIAVTGDVDLPSADEMVNGVLDALHTHHPEVVDLDLSGVAFLDSAGINALLRCTARAADLACRFAVSNPQPQVHRVLQITNVLGVLGVPVEPAGSDASVQQAAEVVGSRFGGASDVAAREAVVRDARATRHAARQAQQRARAMMDDNAARQGRMRRQWAAAQAGAQPSG